MPDILAPLERQMDLLLVLMAAVRPVTRAQLRRSIPGYNQGSEDAILKASGLKQRATYIGYEDLVTALENESGKKWQFIL